MSRFCFLSIHFPFNGGYLFHFPLSFLIWDIEVRYHLDEDPKCLKVFPIPLHDSKDTTLNYDRLSISPDGRTLAATHGATLQWLCAETGNVLDTAGKAHDGMQSMHKLLVIVAFVCSSSLFRAS